MMPLRICFPGNAVNVSPPGTRSTFGKHAPLLAKLNCTCVGTFAERGGVREFNVMKYSPVLDIGKLWPVKPFACTFSTNVSDTLSAGSVGPLHADANDAATSPIRKVRMRMK